MLKTVENIHTYVRNLMLKNVINVEYFRRAIQQFYSEGILPNYGDKEFTDI